MKVFFKKPTHDFPKKAGELNLAWYNHGKVCIVRKLKEYHLQTQNIKIQEINTITKKLWENLSCSFKKDLALYAKAYKKRYPGLRKRGISSYSIMLQIVHALIKRFLLQQSNRVLLYDILSDIVGHLSVYKAVKLRLLRKVLGVYHLNHTALIESENIKTLFPKLKKFNFKLLDQKIILAISNAGFL